MRIESNNFSERVFEEKKDRITNLPNLTNNERNEEEFLKYFESNGIDVSSVREYLDKELELYTGTRRKDHIIEAMITSLSLNEGKEQIVNEIVEKGPFNTPNELTEAIAENIKDKMSYDALSPLFQINGLQEYLDGEYSGKIPSDNIDNILIGLEGEGIDIDEDMKDKLMNANENGEFTEEIVNLLLDNYKNNEKIGFNNHQVDLFTNIFNELDSKIDITKLPENYQKYISDISNLLSNKDTEGLENYFYTEFGKNNDFKNFVTTLFNDMGYLDLLSTGNTTEINDMLDNVRTGVCRHYSVMMREIYNEVINNGEGINFSGESEMMYVLNYKTKHAYNILMFDDENGDVNKQYLDVTSFILGKELFKSQDEISNIEGETWVKVDDKNGLTSNYT